MAALMVVTMCASIGAITNNSDAFLTGVGALCLIVLALYLIILVGIGAFAVRSARSDIAGIRDVFSATSTAGYTAGLIVGIAYIVISVIANLAVGALPLGGCICGILIMLIMMVIGVILAFIGGLIFWAISPKPPEMPPMMPPSPPTPPTPPAQPPTQGFQ